MIRVTIKHDNQNGTEYGYGLYINGCVDCIIYASECLRREASDQAIRAAERRVRKLAWARRNREMQTDI